VSRGAAVRRRTREASNRGSTSPRNGGAVAPHRVTRVREQRRGN
jgi:hypothetical protein